MRLYLMHILLTAWLVSAVCPPAPAAARSPEEQTHGTSAAAALSAESDASTPSRQTEKLPAPENGKTPEGRNELKPTTPVDDKKDDTKPVKEPSPGTPPEAEGQKGDVKTGTPDKKEVKSPSPGQPGKLPSDRPWIIKQPSRQKAPPPDQSKVNLKWKDQQQQKKCEELADRLREHYLHVRYYSIQGDPCVTAQSAANALRLKEQISQLCPSGVLKAYGYADAIFRNWEQLLKLGKEGCMR